MIVEIFVEPVAVGVSVGGQQYMSVFQPVSAPLAQSSIGGSLLNASPIADEARYEYGGTLACTVGGPTASIIDSP